jgi:phosphopentomutase
MSVNRVFIIVLDSFGIGELPDAAKFGDAGSNTLAAISASKAYATPNLEKLGLFNIEGVNCRPGVISPQGAFARMAEQSAGKDTTVGHWEIAGLISREPLPTFPGGFPPEVIERFVQLTGRGVLCNKAASGTQVLLDYGREHLETGKLIVYTSADSVFQIAAHEDIVPEKQLYEYCRMAREMLNGKYGVGRVIARPFNGAYPDYLRTSGRHDYSLIPPGETMLDKLAAHGLETIGVGKIYDIFAGRGVSKTFKSAGNADGMRQTSGIIESGFKGLCFVNLVDFDMLYGHRNNIDGYAGAATEFDLWLGGFLQRMKSDDVLFITADHGCDPSTKSTDHSREYTPLIVCGDQVTEGTDLKTRKTFADISATVLDMFGLPQDTDGISFKDEVMR